MSMTHEVCGMLTAGMRVQVWSGRGGKAAFPFHPDCELLSTATLKLAMTAMHLNCHPSLDMGALLKFMPAWFIC